MFNDLLSSSQKVLLPALVHAKRPLSILALSHLTEVPYATTHKALSDLEKSLLVVSQKEGRSLLFSANQQNPDAQAMLSLLLRGLSTSVSSLESFDQDVSEEDVLWNLAGLGAPMVVRERPGKPLLVEDTVAFALRLARTNPTLARALPLVFAQKGANFNYPRLQFLAKELGETRTLGFFLDLSGALKGSSRLKKWANELLDHRVKQSEPFFKTATSKYAVMLAHRKTPRLARKWHFTMNMEMSDFRSFFKKHHRGA